MTTQTEKSIKLAVLTAGVIALIGMAWNSKADKAEVKAEVESLRVTLKRVDERTARIERFMCRTRPDDLGC